MWWLHDHTILLAWLPKGPLALTQSHLPAHRRPGRRCEAALRGCGLRGRERRQEPAQVHLSARCAARLGGLPSAAAEAHPRERAPKRAPRRAHADCPCRVTSSILNISRAGRAPHLHPRPPRHRRHRAPRSSLSPRRRHRHRRRHHPVRLRLTGDARRSRRTVQNRMGRDEGLGARAVGGRRERADGLGARGTRGLLRMSEPQRLLSVDACIRYATIRRRLDTHFRRLHLIHLIHLASSHHPSKNASWGSCTSYLLYQYLLPPTALPSIRFGQPFSHSFAFVPPYKYLFAYPTPVAML